MAASRKTAKPKQLGKPTPIPASPDKALLERVANPHPETLYAARFTAPEFTCLCPITGQPDFAHLVIDYAPKRWLVESKSLKLYLASFRNFGTFHEDATVTIGKRIVDLVEPAYLRIGGYWFPRGGMPIDVFWHFGTMPEGLWLPDQGVAPYRGRG
jgi:7-cyano-7-deazaguanine reductase